MPEGGEGRGGLGRGEASACLHFSSSSSVTAYLRAALVSPHAAWYSIHATRPASWYFSTSATCSGVFACLSAFL